MTVFLTLNCKPDEKYPGGTTIGLSMGELYERIGIENGMMVFEDSAHLNDVVDDLIAKEAALREFVESLPDNEFANYEALKNADSPFDGKNPIDGSDIPTLTGDTLLLFDMDPILSCFQMAFNFRSLHKELIDATLELKDAGEWDPGNNDPDNFYMPDDYFRSVLNEKLEVKVDGDIYKLLSSLTAVRILGGDQEKLSAVRTAYPTVLDWTADVMEPEPQDVATN